MIHCFNYIYIMPLLCIFFINTLRGEEYGIPENTCLQEHLIYHLQPYDKLSEKKWKCTAETIIKNKGEYISSYFSYGFHKPFVEKIVLKRIIFFPVDRLQKDGDSSFMICDNPSVQYKEEEWFAYKYPVESSQLDHGIPVRFSCQAQRELKSNLSFLLSQIIEGCEIQELTIYARGKEVCHVLGGAVCPNSILEEKTGGYFDIPWSPRYTYRYFLIDSLSLECPSFFNPVQHKEKKDWDFIESYFGNGFGIIFKEKVYLKIERDHYVQKNTYMAYKLDESSGKIKDQKGISVIFNARDPYIKDKYPENELKDGIYTLIGYETYQSITDGARKFTDLRKLCPSFLVLNILDKSDKEK